MPLDFVVKNASKMRSMSFGSIPVPVSSMDTAMAFDSIAVEVTFSTRTRSVMARMASAVINEER